MEYLFGPFRFIPARRTLHRGDVPQRLGGRAFDILAVLLERPGEPVGKRELIERVWPTTVVDDGNLKVHVAALRRTLGEAGPGAHYIATINGRGYCFVAPVRVDGITATRPASTPVPMPVAGSLVDRASTANVLVDFLLRQRLVRFVGPDHGGDTPLRLAVPASRALRGEFQVCLAGLRALNGEEFFYRAMADAIGLDARGGCADGALLAAFRERSLPVVDG